MIYKAISLSELKKELNKNIYCFGAGRAFDTFMREFDNFKLENHIKAIVDNHSDILQMKSKQINGIFIPIVPLNQMLREIKAGDRILITTAAFEEIIDQLKKIEKLNGTVCYIYSIMRVEQYDYNRLAIQVPLSLGTYNELQIPQTIHYCWFGKKEIPYHHRKWMESWKCYCPNYEIVQWNENNYDVHKNKYISQAYKAGKWAFVSDYARIDIINKYGGVYFDTDVELVKNIDDMLMNEGFCGFESCKHVAYGLGFGAKKNNRILGEIKDYYENKEFISKEGMMDQTSSPVIQTEIMKKNGLKCNGEFQIIDGMVVYPSQILCGMSLDSFRVRKKLLNTYAIHHYEGSWIDDARGKKALISRMRKWGSSDYIYPQFVDSKEKMNF